MNPTSAIEIFDLSKKYTIGKGSHFTLRDTLSNFYKPKDQSEFWALKSIDLKIEQGETIGLVGPNGAGKSTLLKLISKITKPTTGTIKRRGKLSSLLEAGAGFHHELTGRENIYLNGTLLGMSRNEINGKLDDIIDFSGVSAFIDTPMKFYSSGMYTRLAFSVATHLDADILLIDEVLAVGDITFQKESVRKMKSLATENGITTILVSHNQSIIEEFSSRVIQLVQGKIIDKPFEGGYLTIEKEYSDCAVKRIKVFQNGGRICMDVEYSLNTHFILPNFGFECRDDKGFYLFSYNLMQEQSKYRHIQFDHNGVLALEVFSPKLTNGIYHFSFYFGDGRRDIFTDRIGGYLSIINMHHFNNEVARILPEIKLRVADE